nr:hypothetical protein [Streptomyces hygroscopicus]
MAGGRQRMRRSLVVYAFWVACLATLVVGILLVPLDEKLTSREVLSSIGLNLVAGVIFAVIFTLLSNRAQEQNLEGTLKEGLDQFSARLAAELSRGRREFLPTARYEPVEPADGGYGDPFNVDMTESLERTGYYAFRGPSARYVAARLRCSSHFPQQVTVAMLSPGDTQMIARRAADRRNWRRFAGQSARELEDGLRDELVMCVVSLFDYRRYCPVKLLYTEDTAVYRYEMFDDSVFVSWYHAHGAEALEMPPSYRFGSESFLYKTLRLDLTRRFDISRHKVTFTAEQDDDFLMRHLADLTGGPVTEQDLAHWRAEYDRRTADFTSYMSTIYDSLSRLRRLTDERAA